MGNFGGTLKNSLMSAGVGRRPGEVSPPIPEAMHVDSPLGSIIGAGAAGSMSPSAGNNLLSSSSGMTPPPLPNLQAESMDRASSGGIGGAGGTGPPLPQFLQSSPGTGFNGTQALSSGPLAPVFSDQTQGRGRIPGGSWIPGQGPAQPRRPVLQTGPKFGVGPVRRPGLY